VSVAIHGFCDERFQPLKDAFVANFDAGLELGASLALTHRGKTVVDLWAGWADVEQTRAWEKDTIVLVASTTKVMTIISALMLVDRSLIDLDASIARYWPEFAQGGKGEVTVRDAFSHQAGVPGLEPPVSFEASFDWEAHTARIAAQPHWSGGQRRVIYHMFTYGFVLGELIRRVDGRLPSQFFREEIAEKVGADFQMGLTARSDLERLADRRQQAPAEPGHRPGPLLLRLVRGNGFPTPGPESWEQLSACTPSGGGYGNGRSIARVAAIPAMGGELDGVRYLSRDTIAEATKEQAYGECPYLGVVKFGLGFGLDSREFRMPTPTTFGWGGTGGSWALADSRTGVSLGYAPNNWDVPPKGVRDPRHIPLGRALSTVLARL
jgi:CubicO group peptidase (beta-lactamase class C family)